MQLEQYLIEMSMQSLSTVPCMLYICIIFCYYYFFQIFLQHGCSWYSLLYYYSCKSPFLSGRVATKNYVWNINDFRTTLKNVHSSRLINAQTSTINFKDRPFMQGYSDSADIRVCECFNLIYFFILSLIICNAKQLRFNYQYDNVYTIESVVTRKCLSNTPISPDSDSQFYLQYTAMVPCTQGPRTLWRVGMVNDGEYYIILSYTDPNKALDGNIDIAPQNGYVISIYK